MTRKYTSAQIPGLHAQKICDRMEDIEAEYSSPLDAPQDVVDEYNELDDEFLRRSLHIEVLERVRYTNDD